MAILERSTESFESRVPVAVVGAGACGLIAGLAARDADADVLLLEQDERLAGSTAMSLGAMCAAASGEHQRHGIDDSAELFCADVASKTEGRAPEDLTQLIARESGPTVDWLRESHDVPLDLDFNWVSLGHSRPRLHLPPGRNGAELMALLERAAQRAGADIMTAARVIDLYVAASGDISGVRIARPDGGSEDLGVNALVLACCGYGGNRTLVAEHIPEMANGKYFGHEGNRGDAVRWGADLGAALADLSAYQGLGTLAEPQAIVVPHPLLLEGGWLVNADGRRFTHENANISGLCVPVIAQPQSIAWVIFDEQRHRACLRHSFEQRQLLEIGALRCAASLDELATLCRLPAAALAAEYQHIAASANAHRPDRFGREFHTEPLLTAPLYAVRVTGALFHTQGGLVVDSDARVCRAAGGKFANLFAGGGAARGISGPTVRGYLPGAGLCMAMTLGRVAGRAAAQQARQSL